MICGELDWVVMKALEKDRARRYDSASSLAADLERFLAGDAVGACPPSALYRWRKLASRHKAAFTTATVVAISLLCGIVATSWQAHRTQIERERAEEERDRAAAAEKQQRALTQRLDASLTTQKMLTNRQRTKRSVRGGFCT